MKNAMTKLISIALCVTLHSRVYAFNLDTERAIFFNIADEGSYFGYSVNVMEISNIPYVLVGSPKANMSWMPSVVEPGGVFKCDVSKKCVPIKLDDGRIRISRDPGYVYKDKKDNQWLGATIALLRQANSPPRLAACAPLWKNVVYEDTTLVPGMCFLKNMTDNVNEPVIQLRPLLDSSKVLYQHGTYSAGQAGMSAAFAGRYNRLCMGATGVKQGTGAIARGSGRQARVSVRENMDTESYIGYAMDSGLFYPPRVNVIMGAPGYKKFGWMKIDTHDKEMKGDQIGAYYGASICAIDINKDGSDDVAVGAPLYSSKSAIESGRVYVYMNDYDTLLSSTNTTLTGSGAANARFGTSLGNVGDLNKDGFNDLAVGAPFENDWSGCVYIYNGKSDGIRVKYSQRVCGGTVQNDLMGFGWSLSPAIDMDGNQYTDFAVGAFLSDDVVVLRARRIINIDPATLTVTPKLIDHKVKPSHCAAINKPAYCVVVKLCLSCNVVGVSVALTTHVNFVLKCDTRKRLSRARFVERGKALSTEVKKTIVVNSSSKETCEEIVAVIQITSDLLTPIVFEAQYDLLKTSLDATDQVMPILNEFQKNKLRAEATFRLSCGDDNKCLTDISLKLRSVTGLPDRGYFISGQDNTASLTVEIDNDGESAYETVFTAILPDMVHYTGSKWSKSATSVRCAPSQERVICNLGNPVVENATLIGELTISADSIPPTTKGLVFVTNVTTMSDDTNMANNDGNIESFVRLKVDLDIRGESNPEQVKYTTAKVAKEKEGFMWKELNFTHDVTIHNKGPSLLPKAQITILVPVKGKELFACYYNKEVRFTFDDDNSGAKQACTVYSDFIQPGEVTTPIYAQTTPPNTHAETSSQKHPRSTTGPKTGESVVNRRRRAASDEGKRTNNLVVDCGTYTCMKIDCSVENLPAGSSAHLNLLLGLYEKEVAAMTENSVILYQTTVYVQPHDKDEFAPLLDRTPVLEKITSTLSPNVPPAGKVALWIYIVSGVAGLLLLIILGVILWKCGFFKRKKHEEIKNWKRTSTKRKSAYVPAEGQDDMGAEVIEPDNQVKPRPKSSYTVSPSEEKAPQLHNKEPLPEPSHNPRPVSMAVPEDVVIGDSMDSLPPPPPEEVDVPV